MSDDDVLVEEWRLAQFKRMGFSFSASRLLHEQDVDLHEAQDLISRGCPPHVAMRILAPLDDQPVESVGVVERIEEYSKA